MKGVVTVKKKKKASWLVVVINVETARGENFSVFTTKCHASSLREGKGVGGKNGVARLRELERGKDEEQMPRETGTRQGRTPPTEDPHREEDPAEDPPPEGRATQGTHTEHTQTSWTYLWTASLPIEARDMWATSRANQD